MSLVTLSWLAFAAYAVHILEEFALDWRNWARGVLGLPVEWADFYMTMPWSLYSVSFKRRWRLSWCRHR